MKKRILALLLILCLLVTPASALTVEEARELLEACYIDEIPEEILALPTVEEILEALDDPYTVYYDAQAYAAFLDSMEDTQVVGIGIRSYYLDEGILLTQVAPDSPAGEGGLQVGDYIVAVDGHDTRGAAAEDIDSWIRGDEGTRVTLTILRGEETFDVTLKRRLVVFPTVVLEKIENGVGWISCSAFGSTTFQYFYDIITAYDGQVDEWVVDLRGNGGGDVYAALFSAGCFAGAGEGTYLRGGDGGYRAYLHYPTLASMYGCYDGELSAFHTDGRLTTDPVYVLTDESTASASELFCAMIRDSGAGLILGGRTYGKGVAQTLYTFEDGSALKLTSERCYSTAGGTYDIVGILPHFLLPGDLADEAAAILSLPVDEEEDALYLLDLNSESTAIDNLILPMSALSDPANAETVAAVLSALPATASCRVRQNGELREVTLEEAAALCGAALAGRTFTDVANCAFADEINTLGVYRILNGMGDGTWLPEDTLTRAELCTMLVKALRCPPSGEEAVFGDVAADDWYAPYVNALYEMGFITGDENSLFHPEDSITHEEFLALLGRVAQWLNMDYAEIMSGGMVPPAEELEELYGGYSDRVRELIWLCDRGLAWDGLENVDAQAATTRAEAAKAVYNLLHISGVLPG